MPEQPPTSQDPAAATPQSALDTDPTLITSAETSPPERHTESAMLDVHPAHHAATTWRDFFIHIATIVLGLLIAVGLEQAVEYFHHRHQLAEARRALLVERRVNIVYFGAQTAEFHRMVSELEGNLATLTYLKTHPHAAPDTWPAKFSLTNISYGYHDAAWHSAENVLERMPGPERDAETDLYRRLANLQQSARDERAAMIAISNCFILYPTLEELSPAQIDHVIGLTAEALAKYRAAAAIQRNLNDRYPDFRPTTTHAEEDNLLHYKGDSEISEQNHAILTRVNAEAEAAGDDQQ